MARKLTNIFKLGRYVNKKTGQIVNLHRGRVVGRSVDVTFYIRSGKREYVSDFEYGQDWVEEKRFTGSIELEVE